ncbi:TPA: hypothetical protein N0F65_001831 [Lagenidium giganteum]|uniref:Uncharacterized protein n=1 Tax=Lagenidium giganteum TaxID=4803 RepID=A0AAV2Z4J5_9STRA|nr:TPA: hypothetical protein N0F65_001831 [Lagenidium giganteum]
MVPLAPVDASLLSLVSVADCNVPELKGYCPVTFQQGHGPQDWASLVRGHVFYRASYESKVFMFVSEAQRRRFLAEPVRYVNQHLPIKLPPEVADVLAKNYPGRLEQELSGLLNQTLLTLGSARPKYLCIDPRASACFFLALCFKTHAKKLPDRIRRHYETQRSTFEAECRLCKDLKRALTPVNASCGTPIKGIRAAKGIDNQQATPSHDDLEELRRRFDAVVGSTPSEARTRALERFLAYAQM